MWILFNTLAGLTITYNHILKVFFIHLGRMEESFTEKFSLESLVKHDFVL